MKLGLIIQKAIVLLQLTVVMPNRRVRYTSIEDTGMGGDLFYYRECKTGMTGRPGLATYTPRIVTVPTPPPRQLMKIQCKMCVAVCCGDDCQCQDTETMDKILQAIGQVQTENSDCKTCVNMCCGSTCQCKDTLKPLDVSNQTQTQPELNEEKDNIAFTLTSLSEEVLAEPSVTSKISKVCKSDLEIVGIDDTSNVGIMKALTLMVVRKSDREKGKATLIYDKTVDGFQFINFCILDVEGKERRTNIGDIIDMSETRRDAGTRNYVRKVLTHDGDISAILKDLVRVTLQKVDLMKKIESRKNNPVETEIQDSNS